MNSSKTEIHDSGSGGVVFNCPVHSDDDVGDIARAVAVKRTYGNDRRSWGHSKRRPSGDASDMGSVTVAVTRIAA